MNKTINILQLYPRNMNIYGDTGNVLVIKRRLEWYGYKPNVLTYNPGDDFPKDVDIVIGGGGQDSGQLKIKDDLQKIAPILKQLADDETPMLVICGLYQLFGKFFRTHENDTIEGIGILNIETLGKSERMTGNIITYSRDFGEIIGYENHSGQTFLSDSVEPLGMIRLGAGNNSEDSLEGARYKNVIGSYLHGSLLPKNPQIADFLIQKATVKKFGKFKPLGTIDDSLTDKARSTARKRPR